MVYRLMVFEVFVKIITERSMDKVKILTCQCEELVRMI